LLEDTPAAIKLVGLVDVTFSCSVYFKIILTQLQKGRKYTLPSASSVLVHPEQERDDRASVAGPVTTIINQSAISECELHT
jgi:biopolymer transport protein ExbD